MAEAAVTFLLENVKELLKSYVDLVGGAKNELDQLRNELGLLKAFLLESAKKPKKEEPFREMERQIREVVYDVEDTIDTCLTEAAAAKAKSSFRRRFTNTKRLSLAQEVKSLREDKVRPMFDKAKMDFANIQIGHGSGTTVEEQRTTLEKVQLIRQDNVVGFDEEEKTIIDYLMEEKDGLDVVSIIGMPGLGKTTLAWKIFQNKNIQFAFPTRIWVYVSQFSTRDVLLNMWKALTNQDMPNLSDSELVQTIRGYLQTGKFLLVMDDVWTVEAWNAIRDVLPKSNRMGKVLITSREENVGKHANVTRDPHNLKFLNENESWELLQLEVFGKLDHCPPQLKDIGKDIAKQCDGLPLAIVVTGGILVDMRSKTQAMTAIVDAWKNVSENVSMYVRNNKSQSISDIVALSYNRLPDDVKDCFLYLAVFPEDYEIPAWTLTRLWIAEGFIQHKQGESLEKTAEQNLQDLINRNLVMVDKTNPNGEVKTCRIHDVIHVFCSTKATEQNLFQDIKMSKDGVLDPPISEIQKYRRICIHSHLSKFLSEKPKGPRVRSFSCFYEKPAYLDLEYISDIPDAFKLLRVLESKSIKFTKFPEKVTKLIHMRYLTLYSDAVDVLPEAISELWNLQTIVVHTKSNCVEIKANIWKMIQLRHVKIKAAILLAIKGDNGQGTCENLQTLTRLSPRHCTEDVFNRVRNLKTLGIRGKLHNLVDTRSLGKLFRLEKLKLVNSLVYESASEDPLNGLPPCFPPSLKRLTLSATFLDWVHMSTLGNIKTLEVLKLKDNAFAGTSWNADGAGFPSLQFLLIAETNLVSWDASAAHFPKLSCLVLKNCKKLCGIPLGLAKSLEKLDIEFLGESAVESARKIEEKKKEIQGEQKARWGGGFKLSVGPGCK